MKSTIYKVFVVTTLNINALSCGFTYGHMTGIIHSLQKNDEGIDLSENEISLIASFPTLGATSGLILSVAADVIGRRWTQVMFSIPLLMNWIILYNARTFLAFMTSRLLTGVAVGNLSIQSLIAISEYTSPKPRPVLISLVSMAIPAVGNLIGHSIGIVIHWRKLVIVGAILSTINIVLPYFWVESPHWLASKSRYEDCQISFRKLHKKTPKSEEELRLLIRIETAKNECSKGKLGVKKFLNALKKPYFWEVILMLSLLLIYYAAGCRIIFSTLATVVLEQITGSPDVFLYTLLVDTFIVVGTCISCVVIKTYPIRTLLFSSGMFANCIILLLSACLYFKNDGVYFQWIKVLLLGIYFITVNVGPYPVIEVLLGEIFPIEIKMFCFLLSAPIFVVTIYFSILFLPYFIHLMGYHGLFLLNAGIMFVCLGYFYAKLPETKGKTLQEIEVYFKTRNFDVDEVLNDNEQIKNLV